MTFRIPYVSRQRYSETEGVNDSWTFKAQGIGKNNEQSPYIIPNEWISANIASFLQLPVPPYGIFQKRDRRTMMFGSVSFEGDTKPKHVKPDVLWSSDPWLCSGILIFDILIANNDRHRGNIKVDDPDKPKEVFVFDHDRALLNVEIGKGVSRLKSLKNRLGISAGTVSRGNRHCLLSVASTTEHFHDWVDRIGHMPRSFIKDVCKRAEKTGASKSELNQVINFLDYRRDNLESIILSNKSSFSNISDWGVTL